LGTDEERKKYTLYFNKKIKEKCIEKEYIYILIFTISIYPKMDF
jgi:hypothetical protein